MSRAVQDCQRGATMVEAVVVLPVFLLLLIVGADMLRLSFNLLSMRFATSRVMRDVSLGDKSADDVKTAMLTAAHSFGVGLEESQIAMCRLTDYPCTAGTISAVGPGELFVLEVQIPLEGFIFGSFGLGKRVFNQRASVIGKMEPPG